MMNSLNLVILFITIASQVYASDKIVMCYYGTWATYRYGQGKFDVEHLNTDLCTHVVYSFAGLDDKGNVISLDPYLDLPDNWGRNNFAKFNAPKDNNKNLKTLLAVGGWNLGSAKFSTMAASPTLRKNFINSALNMVMTYGFNGMDIDWEYPNRRDSTNGKDDIDNFTQLLKELREAFDTEQLLITAAVSSVKDMASQSYDIPAISKYLDLVNIMTYDMYGSWDTVTGHNSPLHMGEGDDGSDRQSLYTVDVALEYWIGQGCPKEKILLGLPLYGRTFTLANPSVNSVRAPASGAGIAGPYTATNGVIGYNEFCKMLQTQSWETRYDSKAEVPYAVQGSNWVTYDDADSLAVKVAYAMNYDIAGIMVWSVETDDFNGLCHSENFHLLRTINRALNKGTSEDTSTQDTVATSTASEVTSSPDAASTETSISTTSIETESSSGSTTTESSSIITVTSTDELVTSTTTTESGTSPETPSGVCKTVGMTSNPSDCNSFYMCTRNINGELEATFFKCPGNLEYDKRNKYCNYPEEAGCSAA